MRFPGILYKIKIGTSCWSPNDFKPNCIEEIRSCPWFMNTSIVLLRYKVLATDHSSFSAIVSPVQHIDVSCIIETTIYDDKKQFSIVRYCSPHHKTSSAVLSLGINRYLCAFIFLMILITVGAIKLPHQRTEPRSIHIWHLMPPSKLQSNSFIRRGAISDALAASSGINHDKESHFLRLMSRFLFLLMPWFWKQNSSVTSFAVLTMALTFLSDVILEHPPAWNLL